MSSERELLMLVTLFFTYSFEYPMMKLAWPAELKTASCSLMSLLFQAAILTHLLLILLVLANWLHEFSSLASYISTDSFLPCDQQTNSCLGLLFTSSLFIEIHFSYSGCFFLIVSHPALFWFCSVFILDPFFCALTLHFQVCFLLIMRIAKSFWYREMRR